jgi:solute carrier family 35 protein F5
MSGFFTLAIGRVFHVETFTPAKLLAVSISWVWWRPSASDCPRWPADANSSFFGVLLVSSADSFSPTTALATALDVDIPHPYRLTGDLLSLLSALFYSIYLILLKVRIGDERRIDMQLFFGFVGLFNIVALWPIGLGLHVLGWETFDWPRGGAVWAVLVGNMFITLISDYLYVKAMLKTTPLGACCGVNLLRLARGSLTASSVRPAVVTIGLSLTIPFAISLDLVRGTSTGGVQSLLGAGLVLASFGFMGVEGAKESDEDARPGEADGETDLERGRPRSRRSSGYSSMSSQSR